MSIQEELRSIREQTLRGVIEKLIEEHEPMLRVKREEHGLLVTVIGDNAKLRVTIEEVDVVPVG